MVFQTLKNLRIDHIEVKAIASVEDGLSLGEIRKSTITVYC